jgi:ribose transport system permease protein
MQTSHSPRTPDSEALSHPGLKRARFDWLSRYSILFAIAILFLFFSLVHPETFASGRNIGSMINSQSVLVILAIASTLTLRNGDFDLSLAANAIFSGAIVGRLVTEFHVPVILAAIVAIVAGGLIGAFNAVLVVRFNLNALVVTLGMFTVLNGLSLLVTNGTVLSGFPAELTSFARTPVLGLPAATWYGWVIVLVAYYVYEHTPLGRYMQFIGGNREATRLAGVGVQRIRFGTFIVSGVIGAFAGIVLMGIIGGVDPTSVGQYLLQPFAAAFLGATAFAVGRFNALGTLAALYFLVIGITGIQMFGLAGWVTDTFNGAALIVAILAAGLAEQRKVSRRNAA